MRENMKIISKEQIDELQIHFTDDPDEDTEVAYIKLDELHALYENAPSVSSERPFYNRVVAGQLLTLRDELANENTDEAFHLLYSIADPTFSSTEPWIEMENIAKGVTPYTTTQPDRVAELEAKLKEYEADAKRWEAICNLWLMCTELHLTQNEDGGYSIIPVEFVDNILMKNIDGNTPIEAIDQAMKG